jgi:FKBP-type peptidyl-prolyl cis-trans isomerase
MKKVPFSISVCSRQGLGVTGGSPLGFDVGAKQGAGGTLKGIDLGVRGMRIGGRRLLKVPAGLAYGSRGYGEIPPNAVIDVDMELLSIKTSAVGFRTKLVEG